MPISQNGMTPTRARGHECHDRVLRRAAMGRGDGRPAALHEHRGVELEARSRVEHDGRIRLDGGLRMPSAHRRTQGLARSRTIGGVVSDRSNRHAVDAAESAIGRIGRGQSRSMNSASASPTLCAPPARAPKRCLPSSSAAWQMIASPSCARRPNSNGRSCRFAWESGWHHEQNYHARAGHGIGQAGCRDCGPSRIRRKVDDVERPSQPARQMRMDVAATWPSKPRQAITG